MICHFCFVERIGQEYDRVFELHSFRIDMLMCKHCYKWIANKDPTSAIRPIFLPDSHLVYYLHTMRYLI